MTLKKIITVIIALLIIVSIVSCTAENSNVNEKASQLNSKGSVLKREAASLFKQGKPDEAGKKLEEALTCYDEALKIDPNYTKAKENRAEVLKALGR
ncbi:MAG: tetratricopeptide repeat protein [Candidatus Eremiobacterota bacterium]